MSHPVNLQAENQGSTERKESRSISYGDSEAKQPWTACLVDRVLGQIVLSFGASIRTLPAANSLKTVPPQPASVLKQPQSQAVAALVQYPQPYRKRKADIACQRVGCIGC